ncbi:MAG TPA: hypothetical protein VNN25_26875, partial [Thermoanaerobaculia bacterium]|nr:hypothetical protein [Thermoanaerobaculia bacterium]
LDDSNGHGAPYQTVGDDGRRHATTAYTRRQHDRCNNNDSSNLNDPAGDNFVRIQYPDPVRPASNHHARTETQTGAARRTRTGRRNSGA